MTVCTSLLIQMAERYRGIAGTVLIPLFSGSVNALAFTEDGTHLISAGEDGTIAVVRTGSWFVEKKWVGTHSGAGKVLHSFEFALLTVLFVLIQCDCL